MKKILAFFLAAMLLLCLAACDQRDQAANNGNGAIVSSGSQDADTPNAGSSAAQGTSSQASSQEEEEYVVALYCSKRISYEVKFRIIDDQKGTLEFTNAETMLTEDLEGSGYTGPLSMYQTIFYDVTYTKNGDQFVIEGDADSVKGGVTGKEAEAFIKAMTEQMEGEEELKKMLKGETLSGKDMEELLYEIDGKLNMTLTIGKDLNTATISRKYTEYGSQIKIEEQYVGGDKGELESINRFENGELSEEQKKPFDL